MQNFRKIAVNLSNLILIEKKGDPDHNFLLLKFYENTKSSYQKDIGKMFKNYVFKKYNATLKAQLFYFVLKIYKHPHILYPCLSITVTFFHF